MCSDMPPAICARNLYKCFPANRGQAHALRAALERAALASFTRSPGDSPPAEHIRWALHDISFDIDQGECVALIGHNGAGKSLLLRVLSRITRPTRGEADLFGTVGSVLDIGVGFNRDFTGRENVFLMGAILGIKKCEIVQNFDEIVEFSGIGDVLDQPLKSYSNGTHVRLAFAIAIQMKPEILLMDEVLAVADEEFIRICIRKLDHLKREGRTILLASHDMALLRQLCTRALWFEHGRLVGDGPLAEIAGKYHTPLHGTSLTPCRG